MANILATPEMMREKLPTLSILIAEPEKITGMSKPNLLDNVTRQMRGALLRICVYDAQKRILTVNMPSNQEGATKPLELLFDINGQCIQSELEAIEIELSELEKIIVEMTRSLIAYV